MNAKSGHFGLKYECIITCFINFRNSMISLVLTELDNKRTYFHI